MQEVRDVRQYRARGRQTIELDQGRILAAREDIEILEELGLHTLQAAMHFSRGTMMRDAGPRKTYRVEAQGEVLYVKIHSAVSFRRRWTMFGRQNGSPARIEWDNINGLRRAGFDVPEPVAFGESAAILGSPRQSFLVTREVPGPQLDELLSGGYPDPKRRGPRVARDQVLRDLSGMIRRFHASGFFHKDLYFCHLIVTEDERWGRPYLIDLGRVNQQFPPRRRWLVKDLAALNYSAPSTVTRADRLRFVLGYLCKPHLDPQVKKCVRDVVAKTEQIASHVPKYG